MMPRRKSSPRPIPGDGAVQPCLIIYASGQQPGLFLPGSILPMRILLVMQAITRVVGRSCRMHPRSGNG